MSFSSDVKDELLKVNGGLRHCLIAELCALANFNLTVNEFRGNTYAYLATDNRHIALRFDNLIRLAFNFAPNALVRKNAGRSGFSYYILMTDNTGVKRLLNAVNRNIGPVDTVDRLIVKNECCKRAYLRGVFLSCGSISDPGKNYHMEFVCSDKVNEKAVFELSEYFGLNPKRINRKNDMIIYFKEAETISTLLNVIGAHNSLMEFESIRIVKDVSNNVNRKVNCETANLSKTINASVANEMDIRYIEKVKGLSVLPKRLREAAELRLQYPDISLREIGKLTVPPISKSGVNHRLRKISEIAEMLRGDGL